MSDKRRGLGRGLGALIPTAPTAGRTDRPVDVFFPEPVNGRDAAHAGSAFGLDGAGRQEDQGPEPGAPDPRVDGAHASTSDTSTQQRGVDAGDAESRPEHQYAHSEVAADGSHKGDPQAKSDATGGTDVSHETSAVADHHPEAPPFTPQGDVHQDDVSRGTDDGTPPAAADAASVSGQGGTATEVMDEDGLVPVPGARFAELPVDSISPNPRQPRTVFDEDEMAELVHSVAEIGVLQPVVVRPVEATSDGAMRYELVMGERRWRASQQAGLATVPAIVRETGDDDLLRDALLENLHRSQLNPLEEAAAYSQLLEDFGCTHDVLATRIGRSRPQISNTLRLLRLPPLVQRRLAAGVLSAGHARALLGLDDAAAIERLAQRVVAEGLSVRAVEEIVALGGDDAPTRRPRAPRAGNRHASLDELAQRLSDRFDTRVQIALGRRKGRLSVEFASVEDLNRILQLLAPGDAATLGHEAPGAGDGAQYGRDADEAGHSLPDGAELAAADAEDAGYGSEDDMRAAG